jgi:hypothetical protein
MAMTVTSLWVSTQLKKKQSIVYNFMFLAGLNTFITRVFLLPDRSGAVKRLCESGCLIHAALDPARIDRDRKPLYPGMPKLQASCPEPTAIRLQ